MRSDDTICLDASSLNWPFCNPKMTTPTKFPVVFIHGAFGYGRDHPFFGLGKPYWPEREILELNPNHILVTVGAVSSDHDRACEAFYQLIGGTVDYGDQHAVTYEHRRFGTHYPYPMYPEWNSNHPIHLVGHSMGATTAIELYQLLCADFFNVGSDASWVCSITSIAGPLTGSTLLPAFGIRGVTFPHYSWAHLLFISLGSWLKASQYLPWLKRVANVGLDQWTDWSLGSLLYPKELILKMNGDLSMYDMAPERRIRRNEALTNMHKIYLLSIVTANCSRFPTVECLVLIAICGLKVSKRPVNRMRRLTLFLGLLAFLFSRLKKLNVARTTSMSGIQWFIERYVRSIHSLFEGFKPDVWRHNDGVVNIHSQLRPWFPKPQDTRRVMEKAVSAAATTSTDCIRPSTSSSSLHESELARHASHISIAADTIHEEEYLQKGRWHVFRVKGNHLSGMYWDSGAKDLYASIFLLIAQQYEIDQK